MKEQRTHTQNSAKCLEVLEFSARNVGPNVYTWSKLFIISIYNMFIAKWILRIRTSMRGKDLHQKGQ